LRIAALALVIAAVVAGLAACGGGEEEEGGRETAPAAGTPAAEWDVVMKDNSFSPDRLTVPAGETVTINLTNEGNNVHNMRIAGEDGEYNTDDDAVSDPSTVPGGETATLEWEVPAGLSGKVDFKCDFHPQMTGTITVE
jgi:plastocyanin